MLMMSIIENTISFKLPKAKTLQDGNACVQMSMETVMLSESPLAGKLHQPQRGNFMIHDVFRSLFQWIPFPPQSEMLACSIFWLAFWISKISLIPRLKFDLLPGCLRLGKTIQVISYICYLLEKGGLSRPFLVAAPASVVPNWAREFAAWAPDVRVVMYRGNARKRADILGRQVGGAASAGNISVHSAQFCCVLKSLPVSGKPLHLNTKQRSGNKCGIPRQQQLYKIGRCWMSLPFLEIDGTFRCSNWTLLLPIQLNLTLRLVHLYLRCDLATLFDITNIYGTVFWGIVYREIIPYILPAAASGIVLLYTRDNFENMRLSPSPKSIFGLRGCIWLFWKSLMKGEPIKNAVVFPRNLLSALYACGRVIFWMSVMRIQRIKTFQVRCVVVLALYKCKQIHVSKGLCYLSNRGNIHTLVLMFRSYRWTFQWLN